MGPDLGSLDVIPENLLVQSLPSTYWLLAFGCHRDDIRLSFRGDLNHVLEYELFSYEFGLLFWNSWNNWISSTGTFMRKCVSDSPVLSVCTNCGSWWRALSYQQVLSWFILISFGKRSKLTFWCNFFLAALSLSPPRTPVCVCACLRAYVCVYTSMFLLSSCTNFF